MDRIVDIATDGLHLRTDRGFLRVDLEGEEQGRIALDDIAAVIIHAHGVTWTTNLVVRLAERGAVMVFCAANHAPVSYVVPIEGHSTQQERMEAQWAAGRPLKKQLWKCIVQSRILMQASLLEAVGRTDAADKLNAMARKLRSGDPDNLEAQASRRYWPALFGSDFRRDRDRGGINAQLNYGYTVLRACVARSVIASGLHPSVGIHHCNRMNAFVLADDLVEPFRPLADAVVLRLRQEGCDQVSTEAKHCLAALVAADLDVEGVTTPMTIAAQRLAYSLAKSCLNKKAGLQLPTPPKPLLWMAIMGISGFS